MERYEVLDRDESLAFASDSLQEAKGWVLFGVTRGGPTSDYTIYDTESGESWYIHAAEDGSDDYVWSLAE
ncbi:hypothetical protein LCGC14_1970280 [marine sediment metagenome]|uniref:Uncharacterized protein n=1 Tax=marine sediment metagenome TaxID=412755 RepID=A0A0F9G077_9ZZZZ